MDPLWKYDGQLLDIRLFLSPLWSPEGETGINKGVLSETCKTLALMKKSGFKEDFFTFFLACNKD